MTYTTSPKGWGDYVEKARVLPPSDLLIASLDWGATTPPPSMLAIDIGCGSGRDSLELLKRGWSVHAIDGEESGLEALREDSGSPASLTTQLARFEEIHSLPPAGLIHAAFSLPFCPPSHFRTFWSVILDALLPGALLSAHLFGDRDECSQNFYLSIFSREEVEELLTPIKVLSLDEQEYQGPNISGALKQWHLFSITAIKS